MPEGQQVEMTAVDNEYTCEISGKKISQMDCPVISPYTGRVYERASIVFWINQSGKDPITGQKLTVDMLVKGGVVQEICKKHDTDIADLKKTMTEMIGMLKTVVAENKNLKQEIEQMKKPGHDSWTEFGSDIDDKIKKGSTPERRAALQQYRAKVRTAKTETEFKAAVNNTGPLQNEKISKPRHFSWFQDKSATTQVAVEFQNNVTAFKGW